MDEKIAAYDWVGARGEKWRTHLSAMEAMLLPADEPLVRALRLEGPARIADVGCGGGGTTLELKRLSPAGSVVHGFDISPSLIEQARRRIAADEAGIAFDVADVATAIPKRSYERLVSRFGIMFFDDQAAAFANLSHWLEPGGRFAFAVWAKVSDNPWFSIAEEVVAELVEVPRPDPDAPGPFRYADSGKLLAVLERAGFGKFDVSEWRGTLPVGGPLPPDQAARFALSAFASLSELLSKGGASVFDEAQHRLTARFSEYERAGAVRMDAHLRVVGGVRV
jgi:SAM-dependent methyltransferase